MELSEKAKKAKALYQKTWAAKNRDKTHRYLKNYWERKANKLGNTDVTDSRSNVTDTVTDSVTCLNCGEPFASKRKTARYCSDVCRVVYNRRK